MLSSCGLIGTALRLAPYALMFADGNDKGGSASSKTLEMRGREVQDKNGHGILPTDVSVGSQLAFQR